MAFSASPLQSVGKAGTLNGVTTNSADMTSPSSPNLIVISVAWYAGVTADGTLTDSTGVNTWTALTKRTNAVPASNRLFYCYNPTVSSTMTFSYNGTTIAPCMHLTGWSGSASSPFELQNGAASTGVASLATGSTGTPSTADQLCISGCDAGTATTYSPDSGFTVSTSSQYSSGVCEGGAQAYKVLSSASAENVTWSFSTTLAAAVTIATFKAAAGGVTRVQLKTLLGAGL